MTTRPQDTTTPSERDHMHDFWVRRLTATADRDITWQDVTELTGLDSGPAGLIADDVNATRAQRA